MKKFITIFLMSATWSQAQTTSQRLTALEKRMTSVENRVSILQTNATKTASTINTMSIQITSQQKTIDSLKSMSNTLFFYSPLIGRDSILNGKRIGYVIETKQ